MKPASLSLRLGLTVSILGALLVVFLAILAYFALTHELNTLSRDGLEKKMAQVEHSLSLYVDANEISGKPHILPLPADRQTELIGRHKHMGMLPFWIY